MTLSSVDIGLPPWEIAGILTAGLALSSFALSGNMRYFSLIFIIFQVTSCFFFTGLYCTHQDISPEYASILLVHMLPSKALLTLNYDVKQTLVHVVQMSYETIFEYEDISSY